jgi:hypothetical protein
MFIPTQLSQQSSFISLEKSAFMEMYSRRHQRNLIRHSRKVPEIAWI